MDNLYQVTGELKRDNLIAGQDLPVLVKIITLAKGQGIIKRGTVLGILTEGGLAKPVDSTKTDGTEKAKYVLADDIDTGDATATDDIECEAYMCGLFNSTALIFGGTDTYEKHEDTLRTYGIYLKNNISY